MSTLFGKALSAEGLTALPFLRSVVERDLTPFGSFISVIEAGIPIHHAEALDILERLIEARDNPYVLRETFLDTIIDVERLPPALTSQLREFSYDVELLGTNPFTGEPSARFVTVSTDRLLTRAEIEDTAADFARNDVLSYEQVKIEASIAAGRRRVFLQ